MSESVLIFLTLFSLFIFTPKALYHYPRWHLFSIFAYAFISYKLSEVTNIWFGMFFFWLLWPTAFTHYNYTPPPLPSEGPVQHFVNLERGKTGLGLLMIAFLIYFFDGGLVKRVFMLSPILIFLDAVVHMIPEKFRQLKRFIPPNAPDNYKRTNLMYGLCGNSSVTATTLSILYAFALISDHTDTVKIIVTGSMLWSMYKLKGTAGLLGFIASMTVYLIHREEWGLLCLTWSLLALFWAIYWEKLISDSGRWEIWRKSLDLHRNWFDRILGIGNGSYKILMPMKWRMFANKDNQARWVVIWQHNDISQLYIESGIIGCVLGIAFLSSMMFNFSIQDWVIFVAILPNLVFNFPIHSSECLILIVTALKGHFINGNRY